MHWHRLIEIPWVIFVVYWAISALKTRRTVQREPFAWRYGVMLAEVAGFVFVFSGDADIGLLARTVFHRTFSVFLVGVALTWAGIALALWARWHLGQYWSGRITLKEDHKLIRTGPYARLRHPIYSGLILAAIGSGLAIDLWRCVLGVCLIIVGFVIKAKREERLLSTQFGQEFSEHLRQTGFLIPRI
ncbi:MAG TPA: isoprenylcysteine carboxylmethyltransferase family protein [Candidatus Aquilonibacter sp.]|nr:isoprenylcysteine carboxylmethyltransferase family protein [Candidatus Aquilonibacter sp.]